MARTCLVRSLSSLTICPSSLSMALRCSGVVARDRMTNDEWQMTKETRNPNNEQPGGYGFGIRHSDFDIVSDFGFGESDFGSPSPAPLSTSVNCSGGTVASHGSAEIGR